MANVTLLNVILADSPEIVQPCGEYSPHQQQSLCRELETHSEPYSQYLLTGIGIMKTKFKDFPLMHTFFETFPGFDELLFPVPFGPSVWFIFMTTTLLCFYVRYILLRSLEDIREYFNLRPETAKLPHIPLYWLQQTEREKKLKREVRTTWAWLAKRYLLSPSDPLLEGMEDVINGTKWEDFEVTHDTLSMLKLVLKLNNMQMNKAGEENEEEGDENDA